MKPFRRRTPKLARRELDERFPPEIVDRILAAGDWIEEQFARGDHANVDQAKLDASMGVLRAAEVVISAQQRGATWTADPPRLACVFTLEARYEEGSLLRDASPTDADRAYMDAKLLALRDILNEVKSGAPIKGSAGLPAL